MERRKFIKNVAASSAAFSIVPSFVLGKNHVPPSDTLYIGAFGVGGRGSSVIKELTDTGKVKFVTLCDVDQRGVAASHKLHPKAKRYKDFRDVYDKHLNEIDAIMVATPDHTHATIALPFMRAKKHAYVEKPLAHNIEEVRLMTKVAKENGIITQMGNQGASSPGSRTAKEWIDAGVIGDVTKVDCWTNRPVWPQGVKTPAGGHPIPKELDWDLWLGPAAMRDYNPAYLPFKWRGWWDFGTGALGDMGCHIMETPYSVLGLGSPTEAEASCTTTWVGDFVEADYSSSCPPSSVVRLKVDAPNQGSIDLNWYDGGIMPDIPSELADGEKLGNGDGGVVFHGTKGIIVTDVYSANPRLLPADVNSMFNKPKETLPRIKGGSAGHQNNWVEGCLNGTVASSDFVTKAGPLTEGVLMGNLAIKAYQYKTLKAGKKVGDWDPYNYPGRRTIKWDAANMKVTNFDMANEWVSRDYRKGWELK
ncbi:MULTISPECIES: Gfo/Idh/MocA family protein [Cellulophaga]|uniref:Oxidoreductase domain protein n=2 Tax=Cellulophaga TaxID=104264 RepID=F0RA83_CELLC|nr:MULTISPECIES: Gfo/Idh/MocA family oxidoreductase [Cellulophaga]ADY29427.1 oxidoreductase domain protein [Cellulophaga lytica DSM 7489]AIM60439.1 dehydrogenase [Cellulophaga lytica]APU10314.1 dehydrogenase [Cellulophaga lytica]EWH13803.1 oxidoreductase domain-containing protein [Cellulophaga geojensis KL-A]TVZ08032.1 oxidoreductase family protein [Cellulophaga sp. RHA_52]